MEAINGIVKNHVTGEPIEGAIIRVKGEETTSNPYGEFNLAIPEAKQSKFVTIRAHKEGFTSWEMDDVPTTTELEVTILMKPAN